MPRTLLTLLLSLAALLVVPAGASAVTIGIADQKSSMFDDPRFQTLAPKAVRISVPWDIRHDAARRGDVDRWLRSARAQGRDVLVTWDRSARPGRKRVNPSPAAFATEMKAFRRAYPFVTAFSTWNEANINKRPEQVARWWLALRKACPSCRVLATDLLDRGNAISWARRFVEHARRTPTLWGLHSYEDANRFQTKRIKAILRQVPGRFWITETGGVLSRHRAVGRAAWAGRGAAHAADATRWLLTRIARVDRRLERIYLYNWSASSTADTWDSALIGPDGVERPALAVVRGAAS